jgi:predicted N-formylglutamate amidohydrolase
MPNATSSSGETARPLLGPDDPPPVRVINAKGVAPILFVCDHASRAVPRSLAQLGLADELLLRHIGWDIGAAMVTSHLSRRFDASAVLAGYSRLVVDCNRDLAHPASMPAVSDGVDVPGNRELCADARRARADALYWPYHAAIRERLVAFRSHGIVPALISIHSFTPVMNGFNRPWHVGILWDKDGRIAVPLIENLRGDPEIVVGDNEPYSAREPAGYTTGAHAVPVGLPHVAVEIRQDLIEDDAGAEHWARIFGDALAPIVADAALFRAAPPA